MPIQSSYFTLAQGYMRWGESAAESEPRGVVLILPGFGEWLEKYQETVEDWNARGYDVVILEWRGQGLSARLLEDRRLAWLPRFEPLIGDLDAFLRQLLAKTPYKLTILAHSTGAHLFLRWWLDAHWAGNAVDRIILTSPLCGLVTAPLPRPVAQLAARLAVALGQGKRPVAGYVDQGAQTFKDNKVTSDPDRFARMMLQLHEDARLKCGSVTFGWVHAAFLSLHRLSRQLRRGAPSAAPYLVLAAQEDTITDTAATRVAVCLLPNATYAEFPAARHELLQETDAVRAAVWATLDAWLESPSRPHKKLK